ncbi:transglycosylase SLT domain-containing protein, partial [bacterium]|nr:transglycosylase SLT domain-containing protein [bacterium]
MRLSFLVLAVGLLASCKHHTQVFSNDQGIAIRDYSKNGLETPVSSSVPVNSANISNDELASEQDEIDESTVVVQDGYVCVPENSTAANTLAEILEQGLNEDLAKAINDSTASAIDPIKLVNHKDVDKWVKYFTGRSRDRFQRFLNRGAKYQKLVYDTLKEEGVPAELYYLAMIESGYSTGAKSWASAVGIWQFIKGTGSRYGLKINRYVDERKDPVRSTRAAARYLGSLYRVYQSWELAMAAYNAGEGRVLGAIMRGHTRDFWELSRKKLLPKETRNYVPKMMAAMKIGQNLNRYNFVSKTSTPYLKPEAAKVPSSVRLSDIAKTAGVSTTKLKALNPHIKRGVTPPGKSSYTLWMPNGHNVASVTNSFNSLKSKRLKLSGGSASGYHKVRRGQNLFTIAKRYGLSVKKLKQINGLRG